MAFRGPGRHYLLTDGRVWLLAFAREDLSDTCARPQLEGTAEPPDAQPDPRSCWCWERALRHGGTTLTREFHVFLQTLPAHALVAGEPHERPAFQGQEDAFRPLGPAAGPCTSHPGRPVSRGQGGSEGQQPSGHRAACRLRPVLVLNGRSLNGGLTLSTASRRPDSRHPGSVSPAFSVASRKQATAPCPLTGLSQLCGMRHGLTPHQNTRTEPSSPRSGLVSRKPGQSGPSSLSARLSPPTHARVLRAGSPTPHLRAGRNGEESGELGHAPGLWSNTDSEELRTGQPAPSRVPRPPCSDRGNRGSCKKPGV